MRLVIHAEPPLAFYRGDDLPTEDLRWARLSAVSDMRSTLRINGGETPNGSAEIDNGDGSLTYRFSGAMLRKQVEIYDGAALLFRGIIRRVKVSATITLELEA